MSFFLPTLILQFIDVKDVKVHVLEFTTSGMIVLHPYRNKYPPCAQG